MFDSCDAVRVVRSDPDPFKSNSLILMKLFRWLVLGTLVVGLQTLPSRAADAPPSPPAPASKKVAKEVAKEGKKGTAEAKPKREWYPFHGFVEGVNATAGTIQLKKEEGQRIVHLDGKSVLTRFGKPASVGDIKPGDYVHGKLHKNTRDEEVITDAKFDQEARKKPVKTKKAPEVKKP